MATSANPVRIGGNSPYGQYFKGRIDEVRIYNRALTASEIQADMKRAVTPVAGALLALKGMGISPKVGLGQSARDLFLAPFATARKTTATASLAPRASTTLATAAEPLTADHLEADEVVVDHRWQRVEFGKPFMDPVVVAKALSYHEATPAMVKIRHVDATGFELRVQSWDDADGPHAAESVGYLVIERGRYTLADGTSVESGTVDVERAYPMASLAFSRPFRVAPVVMTTVFGTDEADTLTGQLARVSKHGFQFHLQEQAFEPRREALETIAYIAWESSSGTIDGLTFEVSRTLKVGREQFHTITFRESFTDLPVFLADIQATRDGNPLTLRWEHKNVDSIDVKIDEDPARDGEASLSINLVGYISIKYNTP